MKMRHAMKTKNACTTCALGMGGQLDGMVNEKGHFPEFCKKSIQAMASDMQPAIPADFFSAEFSFLEGLTPRQLETAGRSAGHGRAPARPKIRRGVAKASVDRQRYWRRWHYRSRPRHEGGLRVGHNGTAAKGANCLEVGRLGPLTGLHYHRASKILSEPSRIDPLPGWRYRGGQGKRWFENPIRHPNFPSVRARQDSSAAPDHTSGGIGFTIPR